MGLTLLGTLPLSAIQIGVAAALPGLSGRVNATASELSKVQASLAGLLDPSMPKFIPPDPATIAATLATAIAAQKGNLPTAMLPTTWITGGATASGELAVELGLIDAELALVGSIGATLAAGLDVGSLATWAWGGPVGAFGTRLAAATRGGWGKVAPGDPVGGVVIASTAFADWQHFGASFNVGTTARAPASGGGSLAFLGELSGGKLNTGTLAAKQPIDLYLGQLEGARLAVQASLDLSLGLNLPSVDVLLPGLSVNLDDLIGNVLSLDLAGGLELNIAGLTAQLEMLQLELGGFEAMISGGGLSVWKYDGPAGLFGASLEAEIKNGIPNAGDGTSIGYGLAIACGAPDAWGAFGLITLLG